MTHSDTTTDARTARFETAFRTHYSTLRRYAIRCGATEPDDVAVEAFAAFWRHLDEVRLRAERAWLYSAVRGQTANERRATRRRRSAYMRHTELEPPMQGSEPADVVTDPLVAETLRCLSGRDQEILLLATWDGLEAAELASVLGISRAASAVRLHRARQRFRAEYLRRRALASFSDPSTEGCTRVH